LCLQSIFIIEFEEIMAFIYYEEHEEGLVGAEALNNFFSSTNSSKATPSKIFSI